MTLGELVDSGTELGCGYQVFIVDPELNKDGTESVLFLDGIKANRAKFDAVFKKEVGKIYPKMLWSYMILEVELKEGGSGR